jgi:hypothetical protein
VHAAAVAFGLAVRQQAVCSDVGPAGLAAAALSVLGLLAGGISGDFGTPRRGSVGASSPEVARAQALEVLCGEGPALHAQQAGYPVVAGLRQIRRTWPAYATELQARTRIGAVVALPLTGRLEGAGTVELFLQSTDELARLHIADTVAVVDALSRNMAALLYRPGQSTLTAMPDRNPDLTPVRRSDADATVRWWQAVSSASADLGVAGEAADSLLRRYADHASRTPDQVADAVLAGTVSAHHVRQALQS